MSSCPSSQPQNLIFSIASVITFISVSAIGLLLPFILYRMNQRLEIVHYLKAFGGGVILSTAYVHMLIPAEQTLLCLDYSFISLVCGSCGLLGLLSAHLLETLLQGQSRHENDYDGHTKNDLDTIKQAHSHIPMNSSSIPVFVLEFGLALHSIIIGITLATSSKLELLIALCFHQFFEAIALSSVLLDKVQERTTAMYLILIFMLSTPVGIGIGSIVWSTVHVSPEDYALATGILEAFGSGVLLYDGLVNIVTEAFTKFDYSFTKSLELFLVWLGAICMTIIGLWA